MQLLDIISAIETWMENAAPFIVTDPSDARTWNSDVMAVLRTENGKRTLHVNKENIGEVLDEEAQEALISMGLTPRKTEYRTRLGRTRRPTFDILLDGLYQVAENSVDVSAHEFQLESRIRTLKTELRLSRNQRADGQSLLNLIHGVMEEAKRPREAPKLKMQKRKTKNLAGIPTLFLSDWHWDEVVDPAQIEELNEYDHDIAVTRARHTFETTGDLLLNHMAGATYEGLVIALGGDMLSGNIHTELRESNAAPITESILTISDELVAGIRMMADEFPHIYIPCVVGNHGRYDRKPRAKGRVQENYDWLVYQLVKRGLRDLENVTVDVSEAADLQFNLYDTTYRLTHGDQFRGGGGIGGKWPTLFRGDYRKRKRSQRTGGGHDYLVMGHWHAYGIVEGLIVNGSMKGYDEYAYVSNFDYEPPTQAMWVTHPDYGLTVQWPIYAGGERKAKGATTFKFGK